MLHFFHKVKVVTLMIVCFFLAVLLTAIAFPRFERVHWYKQMTVTVISPPERMIASIHDMLSSFWRHYVAITSAAKENDILKNQLGEAYMRLIEMSVTEDENVRLRKLLDLTQTMKKTGVGATLIASDPNTEFKTVIIDKGSRDGIAKNMIAISYEGLVGRVASVSQKESNVLLLSDPNSVVDVIIMRSGARALLIGDSHETGLRPFYSLSRLEYLRRTSDVVDGDVVVTSGLDRLFEAGIPIGTVHNIKISSAGIFQEAKVVPFVDFSQMRELVILK